MKKSRFAPVLLLAFGLSTHVAAAPEPAQRADDFVDRIGVATHWGYPDTPYGFAYDKAKQMLGEAGIRHVRDGPHPRLRDLYDSLGIKATVIFGPPKAPSEILPYVRENADLIAMIEGPNEVDIFAQSAAYAGKTFPQGPIQFQNELYAAIKGDPQTKSLSVIAPSTARMDSNSKLAPLESFDFLVMHSYAGGQLPSRSLFGYAPATQSAARILGDNAVLKPVVVTESGYHTALNANLTLGGVQAGVSEAAHAKYIPRHFAEYFNAGIKRTFIYEFLDEFEDPKGANAEAKFGIVRRDMTPKPAYFALKNLIGHLSEAKWDAAKKQWNKPAFTPRALDFSLSGDTKNVHHTLLQKADGDFYLLLWQEVSSFDTTAKKDIQNAPVNVTINLRTSLTDNVSYNLNGANGRTNFLRMEPKVSPDGGVQIPVAVTDEITVVQLTPRKAPPAVVAAPTKIISTATGTTAALKWNAVRGATGYFVRRMGEYLGRVDAPRFDDQKLLPGTGYEYTIQAHDAAGNISPATTQIVMTKSEIPDLSITRVSWKPEPIKAGDLVTFSAAIKNSGNGSTPEGITHGVAFMVDGVLVCWSDNTNQALAAGAARTVNSNSGPAGTGTWKATAGEHTIAAVIDDVGRINESNEANNKTEKTFTVQ